MSDQDAIRQQEEERNKAYYSSDPSRVLPPGTHVLIQNLQSPNKQYLNGEAFYVGRYYKESQRYAIVPEYDEDDSDFDAEEVIGLFKRDNLSILTGKDYAEHRKNQTMKAAALYDPNGVHPPKRSKDKDSSAFSPFFEAICPDVTRYQVQENCLACGKTPAQLPGMEKMKYCTRCAVAPFCSKECQRAFWPQHKRSGCTTRDQRMNLLRSRLSTSQMSAVRDLDDNVLATALDITHEFVDGAQVLITSCRLQADIGDCMPEDCIIHGIRQKCNINLKPKDMLRLATAMGFGQELEYGRKAKIADFQRQEREMEQPRAMALKVWRERLRPLVVTKGDDDDDDIDDSITIGNHLKMDRREDSSAHHASVLDLCDYLADRCDTVRLDQGKVVARFLLLLDELTRFILIPGTPPNKVKEIRNLVRMKEVTGTLNKARDEIKDAWLEWVKAFEGLSAGPNPVKEIISAKRRELYAIIRLDLERPYMANNCVNMNASQRDEWLAAEPGRWLPFDYGPGKAIPGYLVDDRRDDFALQTRDDTVPFGGKGITGRGSC